MTDKQFEEIKQAAHARYRANAELLRRFTVSDAELLAKHPNPKIAKAAISLAELAKANSRGDYRRDSEIIDNVSFYASGEELWAALAAMNAPKGRTK